MSGEQQTREWKKPAALVLVGGLIFVAGAWVRMEFGIGLNPASLRPLVEETGAWAPLIFVAIASSRMFLGLPSQLILVVGGACFGTAFGMLYGGLGLVISGHIIVFAARGAGRDSVEGRMPEKLRPLFDRAGRQLGALFIFVGTAYPIGFLTAYNAIAGVTKLPIWRFAPAIAAGSLIRAGIYAHFGSSLLEDSLEPMLKSAAIIGAVAVLPLLFPRSRRWIADRLPR